MDSVSAVKVKQLKSRFATLGKIIEMFLINSFLKQFIVDMFSMVSTNSA
jgi:hypothetical protein